MAYSASSTFGSLKAKISKKLIDANQTAISDADVGDALNDALHYWKQKRTWFNEGQTSITLGQQNPYVLNFGSAQPVDPSTGLAYANPAPVLPQNFLYEITKEGFIILYSNLKYRFSKVDPAKFDDEYSAGVGMPYCYTFRNGNYEFYFLPNLPYTMQVNFVKDYPDFAAATDTNDFTKYADRLLMYEALSHLFGENRQDPDSDSLYAGKADREFKLIKQRGVATVATGSLTTNSILQES